MTPRLNTCKGGNQMIHRSKRNRALVFGTLLAVAPAVDVIVYGGVAGLLHLVTGMTAIALLAASLWSAERPRLGYERYDAS